MDSVTEGIQALINVLNDPDLDLDPDDRDTVRQALGALYDYTD